MKHSLLLIAAAVSLAACGPSPQYVQPQVVQPTVIQQPYQQAPVIIQQDNGMGAGTAAVLGGVVGAGAGYMLGRGGVNNSTTIVQPTPQSVTRNTTIINNHGTPPAAPVQAVAPKPAPYVPSYRPTPAPARSTPSPTPSYRPSRR